MRILLQGPEADADDGIPDAGDSIADAGDSIADAGDGITDAGPGLTDSMAAALGRMPSVKRKPVARSASWPGVRMVTDKLCRRRAAAGPYSRLISNGSSTATGSSVSKTSRPGMIFCTGRQVKPGCVTGRGIMGTLDIYQIYGNGSAKIGHGSDGIIQ